MFFECHDDPGAGKEEDEEQGVVSQVRPLVHTTQAVVLEDSLAICVGGGGGDGVRMVKGGGAGQGWFDRGEGQGQGKAGSTVTYL